MALSSNEVRKIESEAKKYLKHFVIYAAGKEVAGAGRSILSISSSSATSIKIDVPAAGFSQVNAEINSKLIAKIIDILKPQQNPKVCDLYAGAGNFALPLAQMGADVLAVESESQLVTVARNTATKRNINHRITYFACSVEEFFKHHRKEFASVDTVILDPPRNGIFKQIKELRRAKELLLVSCYLPSLCRDVVSLIEDGWKVESISPFDMFAQTTYVEILVHLRPSRSRIPTV